jgi:2-methylcitrate dehydratase PrpD
MAAAIAATAMIRLDREGLRDFISIGLVFGIAQ